MNWKPEAVDKLKNYEARKRALDAIPREIKRLEEAMTGIRSAVSDGSPVRGGGSTREDVLLSNIVRRDELRHALRQAKRWVRVVEMGLGALTEEERLVLDRFYIHPARGNVSKLREELGLMDDRSVYKRKDSALRHFTIALYGSTET